MAHTTLLKLSDEDLHWLYPERTEADALDHLASLTSAAVLVLTKGPAGALARAGGVVAQIPAAPVDPFVDTVGAGDTFMATLLRLLMDRAGDYAFDQEQLSQLLETSSRAAAINCARAGCQPPPLGGLYGAGAA